MENEERRPVQREVAMPELTLEEVEENVMAAKAWKAPGEDGPPGMVWKQLWPVVGDWALHLFRTSLRDGELPAQWKRAKIISLNEVIHVITEAGDKVMALNSTQSIVITLFNLFPESIYYVCVDNLFLLPDLSRSLRQHGHGATGITRPNCGIYNGLADLHPCRDLIAVLCHSKR